MANMSIGGITLRHNPSKMTVIRPEKSCADVQTYSSVVFFSWIVSIIGREIELSWTYMESDEFDDYDDLYKANAPIILDPQDGSSKTYNAEMKALDGEYFRTLGVSAGQFRQEITMILLILSEVA